MQPKKIFKIKLTKVSKFQSERQNLNDVQSCVKKKQKQINESINGPEIFPFEFQGATVRPTDPTNREHGETLSQNQHEFEGLMGVFNFSSIIYYDHFVQFVIQEQMYFLGLSI